MKKFYMIGNTHFDPVWLWKWDEAMASIRATFRSALDRMKEDDKFVYSFTTPPVFEWIKDTDPDMFEEIKERISEGRWELAEGWWLQPDCYSANGESYIRQGLYGQRYLKENFGKMSNIVFNIDSFGHSPQLPQILSKCGIKYYCFVRPEKHHRSLEEPYFIWKGIDGSEVFAYRAEKAYEPNVYETAENLDYLKGDEHIIVYGVTDHGGAPTKKSIADINASENMEFSTVENFFKVKGDTDYVVSQEVLTGDFGPYSNGTDIKKLNTLAENAVLNAEKSAVISGRCHREELTECWKNIMFNQFHDILGGASIKEAYYDANNLYGKAISTAEYITHTNLQYVTAKLKMPGKNPDNAWNVVVWNLSGFDYNGYIEAEVQWAHEFPWYDKEIVLEDCDGNRYPCQIIREKSVIPRFRSRFVFKAEIPSVGYKAFKVVKTDVDDAIIVNTEINPFTIITDRYTYTISRENGNIESVVGNATGESLVKGIFDAVSYKDDGDTWAFNIEKYGDLCGKFAVSDIMVTEDGIHRTTVKVTSKYKESILYTYYTFYKKESYFDVNYKVNWNQKHEVFKLDMNIANCGTTAGVPAGKMFRKEICGDVPMSKWLIVNDFTFVSDSIFSYDADEQRVGLTVLRSPIYGDLRLGELDLDLDFDIMHQGITEGKVRLYLDKNIDAEKEAELFTNPCVIIDETNHDGSGNGTGNYLDIEGASLMALKHCEDDDNIVIRIREYNGSAVDAKIVYSGNVHIIPLEEHEIATFKLHGTKIEKVNMLEEFI